MQHETFGRDLDDFTSFRSRQGCLEHRLMELRVKFVANFRNDWINAVLFENGEEVPDVEPSRIAWSSSKEDTDETPFDVEVKR